jgi:catechol 2,3-dioxygenase-like lactoylglutathione lyase family enzyme
MIGYVTIGHNGIDQSAAFYDAAFAPLGYVQTFKDPGSGWVGYGPKEKAEGLPDIMLAKPHDGGTATFGNGSMLAFKAGSRANVDAFHAAALAAGGKDEGAPGVRGTFEPPFYGAYVRDPAGNKLCAYFRG